MSNFPSIVDLLKVPSLGLSPVPLTPVQLFVLKLRYALPLDPISECISIPDNPQDPNTSHTKYTEWSYFQYLLTEGRLCVGDPEGVGFYLFSGRISGKSTLSRVMLRYELLKSLAHRDANTTFAAVHHNIQLGRSERIALLSSSAHLDHLATQSLSSSLYFRDNDSEARVLYKTPSRKLMAGTRYDGVVLDEVEFYLPKDLESVVNFLHNHTALQWCCYMSSPNRSNNSKYASWDIRRSFTYGLWLPTHHMNWSPAQAKRWSVEEVLEELECKPPKLL